MLRSVGALVFGSLSDRFGRKWPFIFNLFLFIIFELASGFCKTLPQFLGVRALYGIAMGGLFGPAAATALEDLPYDARGVLSGLYQQGYAMGYLLAAVFYRALVPTTSHGWRSIFWFGAAPPVLIIAYRWYLPETNHFLVIAAEREEKHRLEKAKDGSTANVGARAWMHASWVDIKRNWVLFIYMVFLMTGFNSCSHGVSGHILPDSGPIRPVARGPCIVLLCSFLAWIVLTSHSPKICIRRSSRIKSGKMPQIQQSSRSLARLVL